MDPKEEALEYVKIAISLMDKRDFANAYNMLNQAEGIDPTCGAKKLLRYLHPHFHLKFTPGSQPLEESQIDKEAACSETRPSKNRVEDMLPNGEPPAKKPRIAPNTIPGLKHQNQQENLILKEGNLIEKEEIILPKDCINPQEGPDTIPALKHENQDGGGRTIVSTGSSAWKERSGNQYSSDSRGGYQRDHGEQSGHNIVRALLDQAEEILATPNAEDILNYITTQLRTKPGSQLLTGSDVNKEPARNERRPSEICRENGTRVKTCETMKAHEPIQFELFAAPGPSQSASLMCNKGDSTKGNDKILIPRSEPPPREEPILKPDDNGIIQPPFVPPPNRPGRVTNSLQYLLNFLIDVWDDFSVKPFRQPVDAKIRPDYYEIIRHPMDLGTIRKRLENKYYWSVNECVQDIYVLLFTCSAYYEHGDDEYFAVYRLNNLLFPVIKEIRKIKEENLDGSNRGVGDLHGQNSEGSTSANGEVILDSDISFPHLHSLSSDAPSLASALKVWWNDDDEQYHGYQHEGCVKLCLDTGVCYLPTKDAQKLLARPYYRRFRPPRPGTAVLGSSVPPELTRTYRSERQSTTEKAKILNPRPEPAHREEPMLEPSNVIVQPAVVPPPNRPGRVTNQLQYIQEHVINEVWNRAFAKHFHHPVNAKNLPDYFKIIRHPMDLSTIKKRLENKYYWSARECIEDFHVMFTNFHVYNKPWNPSVWKAIVLEKFFLRKVALMPEEEGELNSSEATAASSVYQLRIPAANTAASSVYQLRNPAANTAASSVYQLRIPAANKVSSSVYQLRIPVAKKDASSVYPLRMLAAIKVPSSVYQLRMPAANTAAM